MINTHTLKSHFLKSSRIVKVWQPENYDPQKKYIPVYVLDASYTFNLAASVAEFLSTEWNDQIPPCIVIGLFFDKINNRADIGLDLYTGQLNERGTAFYNYMLKEAIPHIERNYSLFNFRAIIGYSYTASYISCIINRTKVIFRGIISIAPELPNGGYQPVLKKGIGKCNKKNYYYIATGGHDLRRRIIYAKKIKRQLENMRSHLIAVKHEHFQDEDHVSVIPKGILSGLCFTFKDYYGYNKLYEYQNKLTRGNKTVFDIFKNVEIHHKKSYDLTEPLSPFHYSFYSKICFKKNDRASLKKYMNIYLKNKTAIIYEHIGYDLMKIGEYKQAERYLKKSISLFHQQDQSFKSFNAYKFLIQLYKEPLFKLKALFTVTEEAIEKNGNLWFYYALGSLSNTFHAYPEKGITALSFYIEHYTQNDLLPSKKEAINLLNTLKNKVK